MAGEKKAEAPKQDYQQAAQADLNASRVGASNGVGGTQGWTQGPDGRWTFSQGFSGPLAGAATSLQGQAADAFATPMDWSQFGELDDGTKARETATQNAYDAATRRLDPMFRQREDATRTRLLNQGLDPSSQAARGETAQLEQARGDAYGGAMSGAIREGNVAGAQAFSQSMQSRQQAIAEALRKRGGPLSDLMQMQGLLSGLPVQAGGSNFLSAANMANQYDLNSSQANQQRWADYLGGGAQLAGSVIPFLL